MKNYRDYNIISKKIKGAFTKLQWAVYFLEFWIYFSIEKDIE
jgi:hypothetical protein